MKLLKLIFAPAFLFTMACQPMENHNESSGGQEDFSVPALSVTESTTQVTVSVTGNMLEFVDFYMGKELSPLHSATKAPFEYTLPFAGLPAGKHELRVVSGIRVLGEVSSVTRYVPFTVPDASLPPNPPPQAGCDQVGTNAFFGCYYTGLNFEKLVFTRTDSAINFQFGQGSPDARLPNDGFSVRWRGDFNFARASDYVFTAKVDDGMRVFVDGKILIDEWRNQPATSFSKTLRLTQGVHRIEVEYYESHSSAEVSLAWGQMETLPAPVPAPIAPSAPRNLAASAQGTSQINLTWQAPSNAAQAGVQSYRVYRGGTLLTSVSSSQTSYSNTGLQAGTSYSYQVSAVGSTGLESARSAAVSARTDAARANPSAPGARPVARSRNPASNDTFVSPNGSGSTCSQASPCSLETGLSQGKFIWMASGTYTPNDQIRIRDNKTLEALEPKAAIIDFKRGQGRIMMYNYSVLRNVVVRNSAREGGGVRMTGNYGLIEGIISEGHVGSGVGIHGNYDNLTDVRNSSGQMIASYNKVVDSILRNNAEICGSATCSDSDADGISISSGVGNEIIHCEADFNADDGYDIWRSYKSKIIDSIATNNGKDANRPSRRIGNGNGFKMGAGGGKGPEPNLHVIEGNWSYSNATRDYTSNGGKGFERVENNLCGADKRACTTKDYNYY